jgi:peptide/nickel transport system substrate-binding protein
VFEKKFYEQHQGTFGNPGVLVMGTGPWEVDSLDPTSGGELSANPQWWGGSVRVQHITFKFFSSQASLGLAFRAGEIDLDQAVTDPKSFASTSGAKPMAAPSCGIGFFAMNVLTPPWNDVHVRRAAAYALNRAAIIVAAGGYATPMYTFIPAVQLRTIASASQVNALLGSVPLYNYNVAAGKAEMAQSAYPHGADAVMIEDNVGSDPDVAQVIASELEAVGIHVQLKIMSDSAYGAIFTGPAAKRATTFSGGGCFSPDPSNYTDFLGSTNLKVGQYNVSDYAPPAVDSLIAAGIATSDPTKRFAAYSALVRRLQTDLPYVGLFNTEWVQALSSKFVEPEYSAYSWTGPYALLIKPAA